MSSPRITRLGRYEILGRIATGGMATVYLARLAGEGGFAREFALKVIHPHLAEQGGFAQRFLEEARLASRIRHPNAVSTVDSGSDQGYSYLVLDLIDGVNLRQLLLNRSCGLSATQAAYVVCEVAQGLHALHTAAGDQGQPLQIIHRDLSPHNVMMTREGRAILIDLGLAKAMDREALTQTGVLAGKLPYMSPEQSRFEPLDGRSDVFSMGTVLFELCTGTMPFGDAHNAETLRRVQTCDLGPVQQALVDHRVPQWLAEIILVCLRPNRDDRFQSAAEMADAIVQEMQRHGIDIPTVRRRLAGQVQDAMPTIGTIDPATSLPIRIAPIQASGPPLHSMQSLANNTGPRPSVPPSRPGLSALRWVGVGALASVLLLGGLSVGHYFLSPTRAVSTQNQARGGSLANDEAHEDGRSTPVEERKPPPPPPAATEPVETYEPVETELIGRLPPGDTDGVESIAPRRRKKLERPPELKPNPYAAAL